MVKAPQLEDRTPHLLGDRAYDAIKSDIVSCNMWPGSWVSESQLSEAYPLGRAAIRTAMHRLAHEGLVQAYPRQGYRITPVTPQDVIDLFHVRLLLEPEAARLAAGQINRAQLERLDRRCDAGYDPDDPASVKAFQKANTEFHLLIAESAGNARLTRFLASVLEEMERLYHLGLTVPHRAAATTQHGGHHELVEALAAGDGGRAEAVARARITEVQRNALDALLSLPSLRSVAL